MTNHEILQIKPGATKDEIKKAFYRLAHIHHPDKGGDPKEFAKINNAYQELIKGNGQGYININDFRGYNYGTATSYGFYQTQKTFIWDPTIGQWREL